MAVAGAVILPGLAHAEGVQCHGVNSCKGTGECGGKGHSCAGKNACKGQGWITAADDAACTAQGGTLKEAAE
ncbi:MAG TPA: hypothetical protein VL688_12340 [Verrucomicrobiae bacterium]|nr:hypothetical protein [Verrucomicrobiae bacterium]